MFCPLPCSRWCYRQSCKAGRLEARTAGSHRNSVQAIEGRLGKGMYFVAWPCTLEFWLRFGMPCVLWCYSWATRKSMTGYRLSLACIRKAYMVVAPTIYYSLDWDFKCAIARLHGWAWHANYAYSQRILLRCCNHP